MSYKREREFSYTIQGGPKKNLALFLIDRASKSLLDRDIFIFKIFDYSWRQRVNWLDMKSVL